MGRTRLHGLGLPEGLFKHRQQYRARPNGGKWVYFGADADIAVHEYANWRAGHKGPLSARRGIASSLFRAVRKNARSRGIELSMSLHDVREMLIASADRCAFTGIRFSDWRPDGARIRPWFPSIDRIDRKKGYAAVNCRVVCAYVNIALNEFGDEALTSLARALLRQIRQNRTRGLAQTTPLTTPSVLRD